MKTKKMTIEDKMINYLRTKKTNGMTIMQYWNGKKIYAGIRGKDIRVQVYADAECMTYPLNDYCVAL